MGSDQQSCERSGSLECLVRKSFVGDDDAATVCVSVGRDVKLGSKRNRVRARLSVQRAKMLRQRLAHSRDARDAEERLYHDRCEESTKNIGTSNVAGKSQCKWSCV